MRNDNNQMKKNSIHNYIATCPVYKMSSSKNLWEHSLSTRFMKHVLLPLGVYPINTKDCISKIYLLYAVALLLIHLITPIYLLTSRLSLFDSYLTIMIFDSIITPSTLFAGAASLWYANFKKKKQLLMLRNTLNELYRVMESHRIGKVPDEKIFLLLITMYSVFLLYFSYEIPVLMQRWGFMPEYFPYYFSLAMLQITMIQVAHHVLCIKWCFDAFNGNILKLLTVADPPDLLLISYDSLLDCVELVNDVYGFQVFILMFNVVGSLLDNVNKVVKLGETLDNGDVLQMMIFVTIYLRGVVLFFFAVVLVRSCHQAIQSVKSTVRTCDEILHKSLLNNIEIEALNTAKHLIVARDVKFSAGGLIWIDYPAIFNILSFFLSNIVVLMQFK